MNANTQTETPKSADGLFKWDWNSFLLVSLAAIPIPLVAIFFDSHLAFAMILGLIPAAFVGVGPTRKSRVKIVVLGVLIPMSLLVGSLLAAYTNAWIASIVLALLGFAAVFMMMRKKIIWFNLVAPIVAIGLSFTLVRISLGFLIIMVIESSFAFLISQFFPQREVPAPPTPDLGMSKTNMKIFGVLYGLALFTSTIISWGWDHMGWVVGSTGLVMRPTSSTQNFRSLWRIGSILVGLIIVSAFLLMQPSVIPAILFAAIVMAICAGLNKSRAYIMPLFITICVFMLLEYPISGTEEVFQRFLQRLFEVGLGIVVACVFGIVIPKIIELVRSKQDASQKTD